MPYYDENYYWDIDLETREISNSDSQFRDTYHSFFYIYPFVRIGDVIPICLRNDDGFFVITSQEDINALGQNIQCWKLYDSESGSTLWYSIETQLLIKYNVIYFEEGYTYTLTGLISNVSFNLVDDDDTPPVITINNPSTVTDGETYVSRLSSVEMVQATGQEDVDAHLNTTISGRTITINYAGQTDKKVALTIKGRL